MRSTHCRHIYTQRGCQSLLCSTLRTEPQYMSQSTTAGWVPVANTSETKVHNYTQHGPFTQAQLSLILMLYHRIETGWKTQSKDEQTGMKTGDVLQLLHTLQYANIFFEWQADSLVYSLHYNQKVVKRTSNMTGRHWGPKHKLQASVACAAHFCKFC